MTTKRVLVIEDDADAASVLEAYLRRENYDVAIAGDGRSGLEKAQRWKPDLVLLDVMLPVMNGTEVLATLRRSSDVPVIMVTAMGDTPDRIGALRYGADDYVVKPYHLAKWSRACRRCCVGVAKHRCRTKYCAGKRSPWIRSLSPRRQTGTA